MRVEGVEAGNEVRVDPEISFNKVTLILTLAGLFLLLYYSDNFEIEPGSRSVIMLSNAQNLFFFHYTLLIQWKITPLSYYGI